MQSTLNKQKLMYCVHAFIGVLIMLGFRFIPPFDPITPVGMEVLGIFIGVIYLWTTCDAVWPSLLGVFLLGMSSIAPMNEILLKFLGDATVVQTIFMMIFTGGLVQLGVTTHIARWFLTRKVINGRPWLFTGIFLIGVYFIASTASAFAAIFLFWPIMYGIFKELGFKPGDKYATLTLISIVITALLGFSTAPFKEVPLMLISNYKTLTGITLNEAAYMGLGITISLASIFALILIMRFVFKCDVSKLKDINTEMFTKSPLPAMNTAQKILSVLFALYIILMLLPGILPKTLVITGILDQNKFGICVGFVAILCAIKIKNKPIIDFQSTISTQVQWSTVLLIASALVIGNYVTVESTGVSAFLKQAFTPIFSGQSAFTFTLLVLVIALVLTNFSNSAVVGMIFLPIIFTFATTLEIASEPIVALFIYIVLIAAITPAASPFAAMLHGNKEWLETKDIYKYSTVFSIAILLIVIIIGIPLSRVLF